MNETFDLGVSFVYHYQLFEAKGINNFAGFSLDPTRISNEGADSTSGIGIQLGATARVSDRVSIAFSYSPKTDMSEFDDYAGLFAEEGDFDLPANFTLGAKFTVGDYKILSDIQVIEYSGVNSLGNGIATLTGTPANDCTPGAPANGDGCLGGSNGAGFGWEDMTILKFGVERALANGHRVQFGFSAGDQPIPEEEVLFNILAPAVIENHLTFGYDMTENGKGMQFSFMYAFSNSIEGESPFDPSQTIELEMDQWELSFGYQF